MTSIYFLCFLALFAFEAVHAAENSSAEDSYDDVRIVIPTACLNGTYMCRKTRQQLVPKCIQLSKVCDEQKDCPNGDDEDNSMCESIQQIEQQNAKLKEALKNLGLQNDFSGTGFMFSINNLVIDGGSNVKMFNQDSDNNEKIGQPEIEANQDKAFQPVPSPFEVLRKH